MRYNIKRLFNEIVTYERDIENLKYQYSYKKDIYDREEIRNLLNGKRHAKSLCEKLIGQEVVARWKEGKNLNNEVEEVILIK